MKSTQGHLKFWSQLNSQLVISCVLCDFLVQCGPCRKIYEMEGRNTCATHIHCAKFEVVDRTWAGLWCLFNMSKRFQLWLYKFPLPFFLHMYKQRLILPVYGNQSPADQAICRFNHLNFNINIVTFFSFLSRMKFWSCCERKTSDFNNFLSQEGCTKGSHVWVLSEDEAKKIVECR